MPTNGADEPFVQYICDTEPFCLCVGEVDDGYDDGECCCTEQGTVCATCNAQMTLIDFSTGEPPPH
jgi:hypothetical protein